MPTKDLLGLGLYQIEFPEGWNTATSKMQLEIKNAEGDKLFDLGFQMSFITIGPCLIKDGSGHVVGKLVSEAGGTTYELFDGQNNSLGRVRNAAGLVKMLDEKVPSSFVLEDANGRQILFADNEKVTLGRIINAEIVTMPDKKKLASISTQMPPYEGELEKQPPSFWWRWLPVYTLRIFDNGASNLTPLEFAIAVIFISNNGSGGMTPHGGTRV